VDAAASAADAPAPQPQPMEVGGAASGDNASLYD
jgi:hypothetical protein